MRRPGDLAACAVLAALAATASAAALSAAPRGARWRDVATGLWRGRLPASADAPARALALATPTGRGTTLFRPRGDGPVPVVFFFAGLGGRAVAAQGLVDRLVAGGYAVLAFDDEARGLAIDLSTQERFQGFVAAARDKIEADARRAGAALDALARRVPPGLRLERVGAVGYSFGGAVATRWASLDPRVAAAVNVDGWLLGAADAPGAPLLTIGSEETPGRGDEGRRRAELDRRDVEALARRTGARSVSLPGAAHGDFLDGALARRAWRGWLRADPRRTQARAAALTLDFLDQALR
jgi:dienelactone hydrolase